MELKQRNMKITDSDIPICRIHQGRYGVSVPALTKDHEGNKIQYVVSRRRQYAIFKLYGNKICWKISNVVPTPRNPRYADGRPKHYYGRIHQARGRKSSKTWEVFNWETARYGKIWYDEDVHDLRSVENEFPAIVFNDNLTSNETLSCEPTVSSLNDNEIDFRISFDESDDEDYMIVFDKNLFPYKIISTIDLKTDSENDNEKVNRPLFPSPEPTVSCVDDLDFFKDFKNEFLAIIYHDALTSKSDFSTDPTLCPQHIDEFDLKDETPLSEYVEKEQNGLYFSDLFPFNIIYPDDLKLDKGDDDNEIDMIQSSGDMALPPRDQRHQYLRMLMEHMDAQGQSVFTSRAYRRLFDIRGPLVHELIIVFFSTFRFREAVLDLDMRETDPRQRGSECLLDRDLICGGFYGYTPSYTLIRDPMLRLCNILISCSIDGRSQAPEKGAMISGGQFVARLAEHFGLLTKERLKGLTVTMRDLSVIDMAELEGDAKGGAEESPMAPGGGDEDEKMP
ncbi:hypothetical protein Tco_0449180 [Tanacetum coccineum]